jgi:hypothetical protein
MTAQKKIALIVLLPIVVLIICRLAYLAYELVVYRHATYDSSSDELTKAHGEEFTTIINRYFDVISNQAAYTNPEQECASVTVGIALSACIASHGGTNMHVTTSVRQIRVLVHEPQCAIVMVAFETSGGANGSQIIQLVRADNVWKISAWDEAVTRDPLGEERGTFLEVTPPISLKCGETR